MEVDNQGTAADRVRRRRVLTQRHRLILAVERGDLSTLRRLWTEDGYVEASQSDEYYLAVGGQIAEYLANDRVDDAILLSQYVTRNDNEGFIAHGMCLAGVLRSPYSANPNVLARYDQKIGIDNHERPYSHAYILGLAVAGSDSQWRRILYDTDSTHATLPLLVELLRRCPHRVTQYLRTHVVSEVDLYGTLAETYVNLVIEHAPQQPGLWDEVFRTLDERSVPAGQLGKGRELFLTVICKKDNVALFERFLAQSFGRDMTSTAAVLPVMMDTFLKYDSATIIRSILPRFIAEKGWDAPAAEKELVGLVELCIKKNASRTFGHVLRYLGEGRDISLFHALFEAFYASDTSVVTNGDAFLREMDRIHWTDDEIRYKWEDTLQNMEVNQDGGEGRTHFTPWNRFYLRHLSGRVTIDEIASLLSGTAVVLEKPPENLHLTHELLTCGCFEPLAGPRPNILSRLLLGRTEPQRVPSKTVVDNARQSYIKAMADIFREAKRNRPYFVACMEEMGAWMDGLAYMVTDDRRMHDPQKGIVHADDQNTLLAVFDRHAIHADIDRTGIDGYRLSSTLSADKQVTYTLNLSYLARPTRKFTHYSSYVPPGEKPGFTTHSPLAGASDNIEDAVIVHYVEIDMPYQSLQLGQLFLRVLEQAVTRNGQYEVEGRGLHHVILDYVHRPLYTQTDTRHGWYRAVGGLARYPTEMQFLFPREIGQNAQGAPTHMAFSSPLSWAVRTRNLADRVKYRFQELNDFLIPERLGLLEGNARRFVFEGEYIRAEIRAVLLGPKPEKRPGEDDDEELDRQRAKRGKVTDTEGSGGEEDEATGDEMDVEDGPRSGSADLAFQHHLAAMGNLDGRPCLVKIAQITVSGTKATTSLPVRPIGGWLPPEPINHTPTELGALLWFLMRTCRVWGRPLLVPGHVADAIGQGKAQGRAALDTVFEMNMNVVDEAGGQVRPYFTSVNDYRVPGMVAGRDFLWIPKPKPSLYKPNPSGFAPDTPVRDPAFKDQESEKPVRLLQTYTYESQGEKVDPKVDLWRYRRGPTLYTAVDE